MRKGKQLSEFEGCALFAFGAAPLSNMLLVVAIGRQDLQYFLFKSCPRPNPCAKSITRGAQVGRAGQSGKYCGGRI